ncbi:tyrosine-type recombinase/integrase [Streptomyces longwoodensis]|uniref:tyrosine-type recombinase/integrase n=1 Tax=Streptomyces longwoodensis TaxID=68231 RepID=UPI00379F5F72
MRRGFEAPGSARLELVSGVLLLHPEDAVLDGMLDGWEKQQLGRRLEPDTIRDRQSVVRRFVDFSGEYPWNWTAAHMDEWSATLISEGGRAKSTIRAYQGALRLFCDFITSPHYRWSEVCEERFGTHPVQVCYEWNTTAHLDEYEGDADRRPMTREEVQALFDYADDQVERAVRLGRKGALPAYRDATVFKTIYGWGLRVREASRLDVADFYRNAKAPELGRLALMHVRYGKGTRGSGPRRRMVASVMPWAVESLDDYLQNIRSRFPDRTGRQAVWLTERGGRLQPREIEDRFATYREALGFDKSLVPHCLRHSYVTHLIEDGADPKFVQDQVGHRVASTTAIYTGVSTDFTNTMMRRALDRAFQADGQEKV